MLGWAILFAVVSLAAFYLGFFALAGLAASIAKLLFIIFVALLLKFTSRFMQRAV